MAGEAAVAVGLGALAEEEYSTRRVNELIQLYRRLQELRRRILQDVEEEVGEDAAEVASKIAVAVRRYAPEIDEALAEFRKLGADPVKASLESAVEEYAEVLRLDVPVGGGKPWRTSSTRAETRSWTAPRDMMALFMEYVR
jgi:hypothetical protein